MKHRLIQFTLFHGWCEKCCKFKVKKRKQQNIYSEGESGLFCNILLIAVLKYEVEKCVLGEGLENHLMILM